MPLIAQKTRSCRHCGHDMTDEVSPESYRSNPYCNACLDERVQIASKRLGAFSIELNRGYAQIIPAQKTTPSGS